MSVRPAALADISSIARIRRTQFPNAILGQCSQELVEKWYRSCLPRAILLVHEGQHGVDGFVIGGKSAIISLNHREFVTRHGFACAAELLRRPFRVSKAIFNSLVHRFRCRGHQAYKKDWWLRCIAVDQAALGTGAAAELISGFEAALPEDCDAYWLFVWKTNARAIRFYQKTGFHMDHEDEWGIIFGKYLKKD
jgi:ribosomal protein S18 acetylase RimI-like enzyme